MQFLVSQKDLAELTYHILYEARLVMDKDEFATGVPEIFAECSGQIAAKLANSTSSIDGIEVTSCESDT